MIPVLAALAALAIGTVVVVAYWSEIKSWLRNFVIQLKEMWPRVRPMVPSTARVYGDMVYNCGEYVTRIMHRFFYKEDGKFYEQRTARCVDRSEVPDWALNQIDAQSEPANLTSGFERELQLTI